MNRVPARGRPEGPAQFAEPASPPSPRLTRDRENSDGRWACTSSVTLEREDTESRRRWHAGRSTSPTATSSCSQRSSPHALPKCPGCSRGRGLRQEPRRHPPAGLPRQGWLGHQADQEPQRAPGADPGTAPARAGTPHRGQAAGGLVTGRSEGRLSHHRDGPRRYRLGQHGRGLGLPDLTRHGLRHTGATWMTDAASRCTCSKTFSGMPQWKPPAAIFTPTTATWPKQPSRPTPSSPAAGQRKQARQGQGI